MVFLKKSPVGNTRLYTGREYNPETGLYYHRARYYDPDLGRFISRDPIDIADDVNLYAYVENNSAMFVDLNGLEKVLILWGNDRVGDNLMMPTARYYYDKFLSEGIDDKNILGYNSINSVEELNEALAISKGNIKEIIFISHGNENSIGDINQENISALNSIYDPTTEIELTLIACNTGDGEHSIAQALSNELGLNVSAPNGYISSSTDKGLSGIFYEKGEPSLFNIVNIWENIVNLENKQYNMNEFLPSN